MVLYFQGDICNMAEVEKAFDGVDCVYHMASYGMSGREQVSVLCTANINSIHLKTFFNIGYNSTKEILLSLSLYML